MLAPSTTLPPTVEVVCVPWPTSSLAFWNAPDEPVYERTPINFLCMISEAFVTLPLSQAPFHLAGTGFIPSSPKLSDSGQTPATHSWTPTMMSCKVVLLEKPRLLLPRNSHERVVCSCRVLLGKTFTTSGTPVSRKTEKALAYASNCSS